MADPLPLLMQGQDNFEIVRDQIAALIQLNQLNQVTLAAAEPDPQLWALRVFTEISNPWEQFQRIDVNNAASNFSPIVNVSLDQFQFPQGRGNTVDYQLSACTYNIDIVGFASATNDGTGQMNGDTQASLTTQRAIRFVRRILMSSQNIHLQLDRTIVGNRWIQSVSVFQPPLDSQPVQQIVGARIAFNVEFLEFGQGVDLSNILEEIAIDVFRAEDGSLLLQTEIDLT